MGKRSATGRGSIVEIGGNFEATVIVMEVPLKLLPVGFHGAWYKSEAPLQQANLCCGWREECG